MADKLNVEEVFAKTYQYGYKAGYKEATKKQLRIMQQYIKEIEDAYRRWEDSDNGSN